MATASVALQPELNLTTPTGFTAECVTPEVTDKEIANVLERRLDYFLGLPSLPFADAAPQGSYTVEELGTLLQMLQLLKTTNH